MLTSYEKLFQVLGYNFENNDLIKAALSHRSVGKINNERLEFLGDSLVNFFIADELYRCFPRAKEGELSRLRAHLVRGETLAEIGVHFELGQYLHLGIGERKSGGANRHSILADAVEAIIGAIYLDAGIQRCRECVLAWFKPRIENLTLTTTAKDPKTLLQELLQGRGKGLPIYTMTTVAGEPHKQLFTVQCSIAPLGFITEGTGSTRRKAEQIAAQKMLDKLD